MNTEIQNQKTSRKAEIMAGLLFLMFLLGTCLAQAHHPWTCEQAREVWQKNQSLSSQEQNHQLLTKVMSNRDTIHLCQ